MRYFLCLLDQLYCWPCLRLSTRYRYDNVMYTWINCIAVDIDTILSCNCWINCIVVDRFDIDTISFCNCWFSCISVDLNRVQIDLKSIRNAISIWYRHVLIGSNLLLSIFSNRLYRFNVDMMPFHTNYYMYDIYIILRQYGYDIDNFALKVDFIKTVSTSLRYWQYPHMLCRYRNDMDAIDDFVPKVDFIKVTSMP